MSDFSPIEPKLGEDGLPVPNLPLLRKVLDHIDAHPEEWHQERYGVQTSESACGTAFCIAGHAAVMSGYQTRLVNASSNPMLADVLDFIDDEGSEVDPFAVGCEVLGLTNYEGESLFDGDNTRFAVQREAEAIAARAGERL